MTENLFENQYEKRQREMRKEGSRVEELEAENARLREVIANLEKRQYRPLEDKGLLRKGAHDTETEAANMQVGRVGSKRQAVFAYIETRGAEGSTDDEIMIDLEFSHSNATARRGELARGLHVVDSGKRRKTRTGSNAIVWVLPKHR